MDDITMSSRPFLGRTCRIYLKSSSSNIVFPLNGFSRFLELLNRILCHENNDQQPQIYVCG